MGGWKKEVGGKPHEWHPSQNGVLDPPRTVRFPPPSGVSALCFLYKNPRQSRPEALLELSKNFREGAFSGTFSTPHTFCTPPYHGPIFGGGVTKGNSVMFPILRSFPFQGFPWSCRGKAKSQYLSFLGCWVGHLRCEGVAERKCGNYRSGFLLPLAVAGNLFRKNEMRKLDIFQIDGFKCDFGGGNRMGKRSVSMRKLVLRELNAENCVQGPLNGGVSNGGVSRSGLVHPFLSFFVLFRAFPNFLGFSRFARGWSGDFPDLSFSSFSAY